MLGARSDIRQLRASGWSAAEERLKSCLIGHWATPLALLLIGLALGVRAAAIPFQSWDYKDYFQHWFNLLSSSAGLTAFGGQASFSDYTPPYLYLLRVGSLLFPTQALAVVKGISFPFEALLAIGVYLLVRSRYPNSAWVPLAAAAWVLFSPTVVLDGAVWGQSDAIYTSVLVLCIYWVIRARTVLAFVAFALAFACKAQAGFLFPLLVVVYFRRRVSVVVFAIIPLTYVAMMLPAVLAGMRWSTALGSYLGQATFYRKLAMNAPTLLAWIPNKYYDVFLWVGLGWATAAVLGIVTVAVLSKHSFSATHWLTLSLTLLLVVPYFTPGMHDRFFYPADIVSVVYAFYVPRRFYLPILITTVSLLCYFPYLFDTEVVPINLLSLVMLIPITVTTYDYVRSMAGATSIRRPQDGYPSGRENAAQASLHVVS